MDSVASNSDFDCAFNETKNTNLHISLYLRQSIAKKNKQKTQLLCTSEGDKFSSSNKEENFM